MSVAYSIFLFVFEQRTFPSGNYVSTFHCGWWEHSPSPHQHHLYHRAGLGLGGQLKVIFIFLVTDFVTDTQPDRVTNANHSVCGGGGRGAFLLDEKRKMRN